MFVHLFVALSFASLLTAMLAFRFELGRRPVLLASYFAFFASLEMAAETYVLPPEVFGPEVGIVLTVLTVLFIAATFGARRVFRDGDA